MGVISSCPASSRHWSIMLLSQRYFRLAGHAPSAHAMLRKRLIDRAQTGKRGRSNCLNNYQRKVIVLRCGPYPLADFLRNARNHLVDGQRSKATRKLVKPFFAKLLLFGIERFGYAVCESKHNVPRL